MLGLLGSFSQLSILFNVPSIFALVHLHGATNIFFPSLAEAKVPNKTNHSHFELQLNKSIELLEALFLRVVKGLEKISILQHKGKLHAVKRFYHSGPEHFIPAYNITMLTCIQ